MRPGTISYARRDRADRARTRVMTRRRCRSGQEPVRCAGVELPRRSPARADRDGGRRNPWLKVLDRAGTGFGGQPPPLCGGPVAPAAPPPARPGRTPPGRARGGGGGPV